MKNMNKPQVIYEDNDIIVLHKPAGMATQTKRIGQQDMESFIRNYRAAKNEPPYVGIVHRLDQPVEGVMVFAKNQKAAASLSRQIREHTTEKYYYAASLGDGAGREKHVISEAAEESKVNTLIDYIAFDKRTNTSRITSAKDSQAKKAVLEYKVVYNGALESDDECNKGGCNNVIKTVFDIKLLTGRHHQIRLQFANIGYPLISDTKYGTSDAGQNAGRNQRGRSAQRTQLALCSYKIVIDHPANGKRMTFEVRPQNPVFEK